MASVVQIVVTPGSGNGRAPSTARRLQKALARRGYEAHIQTFSDYDRLVQWAAICAPKCSHLVGVGGDSTLEAVARAAVRLGIPFVPVPNGFGNIFARVFGHTDGTQRVMELFERGRVRRIDVGTVNHEQMFLTHQGYGMLEEIEQAVERGRALPKSRLLRHLAYYAMARRFLFNAPLPAIRVEAEGTLLCEDAAVVIVANVETFDGYLNLTPSASPLDGCFDVSVIPRTTRLGVWLRLLKFLLGLPGRWNGIMLCRGRRVRVTVGDGPPEELAVRPSVLPLLIPPGSVERLRTRQAGSDVPVGLPATLAPAESWGTARGWLRS